ncbi:hypothetical protein [Streptomyces sp. 8L]|uniref:hypothetical protein n=1 Tax=Streptomyces sp. 8L TaxID=2877242 RepID=UPI001CD5E55E|nr:hypothetical protein [Streptomyces sp. 8L]MCA1222210.1 hypothetical protein [Streptomyces sp. 8L]
MNAHLRESLSVQPAWVRGLRGPELFAAGRGWDAIRVEAGIGLAAVRFLEAADAPVGPVLHDRGNSRTYFLAPPGTARRWRQERTRALGDGAWLVLVPPEWDGLLRWASGPCDGLLFTEVEDLVTALTAVGCSGSAQEVGR